MMDFIDENHEINGTAPFYREKKPSLTVLGVENKAWLMRDSVMVGKCVNPNCLADQRFFQTKALGHTFFFDIDERCELDYLVEDTRNVIEKFNLSHAVITETNKGFHVWITEIKAEKIGWFRLFKRFKDVYESDYEFNSQWILRTGYKGRMPAPRHVKTIINELSYIAPISSAHLVVLATHTGLPAKDYLKLLDMGHLFNTFAKQVVYHSWDLTNENERIRAGFKDNKGVINDD